MQPLAIPEAVARRDAARTALDLATATRHLATEHADAADQRVAQIAEIEAAATVSFVDRIRQAAANGAKLDRDAPSADAIARSAAEAEARSARTALRTLTDEHDTAAAMLRDAELDLQIATNGACNEEATAILEAMDAAYQLLTSAAEHLRYLERASFTPMPQPDGPRLPGAQSTPPLNLKLNERARVLMRAAPDGTMNRTTAQKDELVAEWRAWRAALVDDPAIPSPWAKRE